ncbi:hypothetical protein AVEN_79317-1 [Araneus ventricosus]|uniref:Uncharacterized protein n=1 Tax=Araneus ventricosus TaxID=182803 RepID=A0A4Y2K0R0_ARAVE|nr:hypothetical protein AVEN_79317-1 [Araneus ventricosus]
MKIYISDHFLIILSHGFTDLTIPRQPSRFIFGRANWLSELAPDIVNLRDTDAAVVAVVNCILRAAEATIPKSSGKLRKLSKPWWNERCSEAHKPRKRPGTDFEGILLPLIS